MLYYESLAFFDEADSPQNADAVTKEKARHTHLLNNNFYSTNPLFQVMPRPLSLAATSPSSRIMIPMYKHYWELLNLTNQPHHNVFAYWGYSQHLV